MKRLQPTHILIIGAALIALLIITVTTNGSSQGDTALLQPPTGTTGLPNINGTFIVGHYADATIQAGPPGLGNLYGAGQSDRVGHPDKNGRPINFIRPTRRPKPVKTDEGTRPPRPTKEPRATNTPKPTQDKKSFQRVPLFGDVGPTNTPGPSPTPAPTICPCWITEILTDPHGAVCPNWNGRGGTTCNYGDAGVELGCANPEALVGWKICVVPK